MEALILPACLEIEANKAKEMEKLALLNNICIDDMSNDIKATLIHIIIKANRFLFQIEESTCIRKCQTSAQLEFPKRNAGKNISSL